jgi:hypothetical protein
MTTYAIELSYESGRTESVPLTAKTQAGAVRQLRQWLADNPAAQASVYLGFFRSTDGCHGYINTGGASPTGKAWRKAADSTEAYYDIYWLDEGNGTEGHPSRSVAEALDWANNEGSGRIRIEDSDGKVVMETNDVGEPLATYCAHAA